MNAQHERILGIIADLAIDGREVDEYSVAQACGAIPAALPRHSWVNHSSREDLLHAFTILDQHKLIYVTRRGYWGLHLTKRGRQHLERPVEPPAPPPIPFLADDTPTPPTASPQQWEGPRPTLSAFAPRQDHFYSTLALAVVALGALLLFAFGQSTFNPVAGPSAAAPEGANATPPSITLPTPPPPTPAPATQPTATPTPRTFVVANTGGDGVFLRSAPLNGARLGAWGDGTPLQEIGPEQSVGGVQWRHVRTPDGGEGYVPSQYTAAAP